MFTPRLFCLAVAVLLGGQRAIQAADNPPPTRPAPQAAMGEYNLADFGPVTTPAQAQATLDAAITNIIARGGGVLVVGPGASLGVIENNAPASTRGTPTVTIMDRRSGYESVLVPANGKSADGGVWAGRRLARTIRQPIDRLFGVHSTESIDTYIAGGTTSYDQPSLDEVKAGKDQRIYVPSVRGLAVGNQMALSGVSMSYGEPYDRGPIKALGWDKERGQPYAVMDLQHDHPKGALFYDKHVVNSLSITDHSQSDNQSMGLHVTRKNYAQGDSFVISAQACTMGNVMSGAGDEGGLTYGADIYNDLRPFRSTVETVDWSKCELVYAPGPVQDHTLGTSRPLVNLNTDKWITQGAAYYVSPGFNDPWHPDKQLDSCGGLFGSKDCGWTQDVVGRFFAIDEPSEYLDPQNDPGAGYTAGPDMRVYRWYQISKLEDHADGIKRIYLDRTRWWVRSESPSLYDTVNRSYAPRQGSGQLKPLRYVIAPGAVVADVSRAWTDSSHVGGTVDANMPRTLVLAPSSDAGTKFDFEKGDPIVQAIGPDPWNVTGMRVRHHNYLPSTIGDASLAAVNVGRVAVDSALGIHGGSGGDLADDEKRSKDRQPAFLKGIDIRASTDVGIRFGGDVGTAAITFEQPHARPQPMIWKTESWPFSAPDQIITRGRTTMRTTPAPAAAHKPFPTPEDRILCVYWTDTATVIDGKMDEAVWRQADVAKGFVAQDFGNLAVPNWRATQQTEVRALYDAGNLYLFWMLYEERMDKLSPGIAEVERDHIGDWGDVPEIFLDPGRSERDYFQFACNAQAARYDMASKLGTGMAMRYTPDWECAVGRFEGGWTVEQRIPFGELALEGQSVGTPQVGDRWGINFCRNEGRLNETSQWAPTVENGFRDVERFGNAVFKGRKDSVALPSVKADPGPLFYGPGALEFAIRGAAPPVRCRCVLSREGKIIEEMTGELTTADGTLRMRYRLIEPGNLRFKFSLTSGGQVFHAGQAATLLPPTRGLLDEMNRDIREGKQTLVRLGDIHPHFAHLRQRADGLDERVNALRQQIARAKELTVQQWRGVVRESERSGSAWQNLRHEIELAGLYPGNARGEPCLFAVGNGSESDPFHPDTLYRGSFTEPIRLSLAGNEHGTFQLVVIPFWQDLKDVTLSFTPLTGPDGRPIPIDQYRWSRKEYVRKENKNPPESYTLVYEPDEPGAPFAAPAGQVQAVWVDLLLPEGTPPGNYTGQVTVAANAQSFSRDVEVRASGNDIPKRRKITLAMVKRTTLIKSEDRTWFPRIHRMADGTIIATAETATDETAPESTAETRCLRSADQGETWHAMESFSKGKAGPCHITLRDGTYLQLWFYTVRHGDGWVTKVTRSTDHGLTYTTTDHVPVHIDNVMEGLKGTGMAFDSGLVEMDNGELLATMYGQVKGDRKCRCVLMKSTDKGQSWHYVSTIAYDADAPGEGFCEPCMIRTGANHLLVLMRTGSEPGVTPMYQTVSVDNGLTWSKPVPVADRGVEPHVVLTKGGMLVCSYGRPDVYAMYSPDGEGREWTGHMRIFHGKTTSYTGMVMTGPDRILLIHDARHHMEKGDDKPYYYVFGVLLRIDEA